MRFYRKRPKWAGRRWVEEMAVVYCDRCGGKMRAGVYMRKLAPLEFPRHDAFWRVRGEHRGATLAMCKEVARLRAEIRRLEPLLLEA